MSQSVHLKICVQTVNQYFQQLSKFQVKDPCSLQDMKVFCFSRNTSNNVTKLAQQGYQVMRKSTFLFVHSACTCCEMNKKAQLVSLLLHSFFGKFENVTRYLTSLLKGSKLAPKKKQPLLCVLSKKRKPPLYSTQRSSVAFVTKT